MSDRFLRTRMLLGDEAMERLGNSRVAVFGVGGVGGYVVEALVRSGVGTIDVFDNDTVCDSNINRQIIALNTTIGMAKVDVVSDRAKQINPDIVINAHKCFYMPDNADDYDLSQYSYIVDAIDTVTAKIELAVRAEKLGVPIISSMGTGNKLDPTAFKIADIKKTSVCPLARVMRYELRKRGIEGVRVLFSTEEPKQNGERTPASISFVPSVAGLIIAGETIKDLIKKEC